MRPKKVVIAGADASAVFGVACWCDGPYRISEIKEGGVSIIFTSSSDLEEAREAIYRLTSNDQIIVVGLEPTTEVLDMLRPAIGTQRVWITVYDHRDPWKAFWKALGLPPERLIRAEEEGGSSASIFGKGSLWGDAGEYCAGVEGIPEFAQRLGEQVKGFLKDGGDPMAVVLGLIGDKEADFRPFFASA